MNISSRAITFMNIAIHNLLRKKTGAWYHVHACWGFVGPVSPASIVTRRPTYSDAAGCIDRGIGE